MHFRKNSFFNNDYEVSRGISKGNLEFELRINFSARFNVNLITEEMKGANNFTSRYMSILWSQHDHCGSAKYFKVNLIFL